MRNLILICAATFVFASCAKEGLGGDATLVVKPTHHGTPIYSTNAYRDSVYVKFNVTELPADPTHDYDHVFVGTVGEAHVHCEGLKWGNYSLYTTGWDPAYNKRVVGGSTIKIKRKERDQEINVEALVSE